MKIIVCDIDGTIADLSHRLYYIQGDNKDWEKFFNEVDKDKPIEGIIDILYHLVGSGEYRVVFCTGRNEVCEEKTKDWCRDNVYHSCADDSHYDYLMRKQNDYRPDTEVKPELLEQYLKDNPDDEVAFILDDRNSMVKKWRELGFTCLQVCEGDF